MADKPIGNMKFGIGIDGVDETINTLDKVNKALKQQESAMKTNLSTFDKAGNSLEKLSQKEKDLATTTELQAKKVDILTKRRDEAVKKYGEESKQVQNLTTQINNASTKYNGFKKDLDKTQESLINMGSGVSKLSKELKDNANDFNKQAAAMDKSGDKMGALETRQEGLKKQATLTAQAIDAQENAIKQMANQFGKSSTQVQQAESKLAEFKKQASGTDKELDSVTKGMKDVASAGKGIEGGLTAGSAALGGLVAGVAASVSTKALDMISDAVGQVVENIDGGVQAVSDFKARLGLSSEEATTFSRLANDLVASGLAENMEEASNYVYTTKQNMKGLNDQDLSKVSGAAAGLERLFDSDMDETLRGASNMMKQFEISGTDAMDLIVMGTQRGLDKTHELGDNLAEYSTNFKDAGFSAQEMFAMLQAGTDAGNYNLDKTNDLIKEFNLRIKDPAQEKAISELGGNFTNIYNAVRNGSLSTKDAMGQVTKEISNMSSDTEKATAIATIFGTQGEDAGLQVVESMGAAARQLSNTKNGYDKAAGSAKKFTDEAGNTTPFDALKSALASVGTEIGIQTNGFSGMTKGIETVGSVARDSVAPIMKALAPIIGKVFDTIKSGAEGASGLLMIFGDYVAKVLYPMIKPILTSIADGFKDIFGFISSWWDKNGDRIMKAFTIALQALTPMFKVAILVVKSFVDSVIGFIKGMVKVITGVIDVFSMVLTGDFRGMWDSIKNIFFGAIQAIWNWINILFIGKIVKGIGGFVGSMKGTLSAMWNAIKSFFSGGITNTGNLVKNWIANVWNLAKNLRSNVSSTISNLWNGIKSTFRGGIDTVANWFSQLPSKMVNAIKGGAGSIKSAFKGVFNGVLRAIGSPVNGIIGGANWVLEKLGAPKLKKWDVPQYANGTPNGGHVGGAMMVNDGAGAEAVISPDGNMVIPSGKNVVMYGQRGTQVMNAEDTAAMLGHSKPKYRYKNGTGFMEGLSSMWSGVKDVAGNIGNKMKSIVGDVMDYIDDPMKLAKKVISNAVNLDGMGGLALGVGKGLMNKSIEAMKNKIKELFEANQSLDTSTGSHGVYKYLADVASKVMQKFSGMSITSGYRAGDPYSHGSRNAIDIAFPASMNGSQANVDAANYAFDSFKNKVGYVITNGRVRDRAGTSGTGIHDGWAPWTDGDHYDHVHINGVKNPQQFGGAIASGQRPGGDWASQIRAAAKMMGQTVTQSQVNGLLAQIQLESGGRESVTQSTAVWDINAQTGNLAQGLLQYVPSTFRAFMVRGYENINKGFDQLMAFFNNSNWRNDIQYGRSGWGPRGSRIKGYENGAVVSRPQTANLVENGYPEVIIPTEPAKRGRAMGLLNTAKQMLGVKDNARVAEKKSANDDMATMISLMQQQNELLLALLSKDPSINLNGVKLNDGLKAIQATDRRNANRDLGLV